MEGDAVIGVIGAILTDFYPRPHMEGDLHGYCTMFAST